ncbi:uncharacterized protein LOC126810400 isoform X2 [Patella vulgata]|uniref:uncharacterized protein LOC126810400 isoform X2 n=1 Tax=Patella vulgata TaxID=6465 RepID=UPI0024A91F24|nr:uncharacterized protein LOC126810400 isoform X2 [Patella vulgata]
MADTTTVVEGKVKYRDGRKWKQRWCVLKKPSPVADRLQVLLYKDVKDAIKDGSKPKSCFPIESFFGLQSGFSYDKENNALAIICQKQVTLFSFENREDLINFEIKIRKSLGEERQFSVQVAKMPSHSKLPHDFIQMLIHGQKFCLISQVPPKILQSWHISDLRRFGTVDGKFLFEGGSRCNKGSGLHAVISDQIKEIDEIINLASVGKTTSCHRNTNKRGSQFSEAFDSFNTFSNFFNNNQMVDRPSMLSCCNENNNLHEVDEMGFHKRHSISVMDYRRMASLTEKFKLMSMENLERQRMLAMYDIPPKYAREVRKQKTAQTSSPKKTNTNRYSVSCSELKGGNGELSRLLSDSLSQSFNTHIYTNTPLLKPELPVGAPASPNHQDPSSNSHYSHCYQKNKPLTINPLCIIEDEARTAFDRSKRQEAMQRLQKQENDLHKEITLLDEILQVCKTDEPQGATSKNSTNSLSEKASSLPNKVKKELRGENFMSSQTSISSSSEGCAKSSLSHSDLLYPKPVKRTKISAPLPYVNLSQFDVGDDNGRVHLSKEGLVTGSSSGSINKSPDKNHSTPIKKSSESLCSSSSGGSHTALYPSEAWMREPIYANEPNRCETPPPELPPKGPALLRKNRLSRNSTSFSQSSKTPPPLPPSRNRSRSLGSQTKLQVNDSSQTFNSKSHSFDQVVPLAQKAGVEDTYLMMGGFPDQPKEKKKSMVFDSPEVKQLSKGNADVMNCYMDMAAFFKNDAESRKGKSIPQVKVEEAIYDTIDDTIDNQAEPASKAPIRESNYMVMEVSKCRRKSSTSIEDQHSASPITNKSSSPLCIKRNSVIQRLQTLQNYVSTTKAGEMNSGNGSVVIPKPTMPFQNLLEFKPQHLHSAGVYINPIQDTNNSEETSPEPTSKKEEGFLARFKRRNSKDQSKASLSTENLMTKTSRTSLFEKSLSEEGELVENSSSPLKISRQRSSSFPNRRSYQEDETDTIEIVNDSLKSDSTNDVFSHSDDPPDETFFSSSSIKLKTGSKNNIDDVEEPKKEMHVLTVLHLQHDPPVQSFYSQYTSSKTDDEKMIDLLHTDDKLHNKKFNYSFMSELKSKLSLPLSKAGSELPTECQSPALPPPPVLPPKFRMYPTLSPVVETTPSSPLPPAEPIYVEMTEPAIKPQSMSETVQQPVAHHCNETNQQDEDYCQNINIDYRETFSEQ